ncbi:MAG: hypothetical protein AAFR71_09985 [Pseudomonadota bacterium]
MRIVRSVQWNEELAKFIVSTGTSGDELLEWIHGTLLDHPEYELVMPDGSVFDPNSDDTIVLATLDNLFGKEDQRRGVNRYKERADGGFKNRLCQKLVPSVICLFFARQILLNELANEANAEI